MAQLLNCWQFKNCGREEGGVLADVSGVCPVSTSMKHDGTNGGLAAGRICWELSKSTPPSLTACVGHGATCQQCAFYKRVHFEGIDKAPAEKPPIRSVPTLATKAEPE